MNPRLTLLVCLACAAVTGCSSDMSLSGAEDGVELTSAPTTEAVSLRLDVYPAATGSEATVPLPQSFFLDDARTNLALRLESPVQRGGVLLGFQPNPTAEVSVPGAQAEPLAAAVQLAVPGAPMGGSVRTDVDGAWGMEVVPGYTYTFVVQPDDAGTHPLYVNPAEAVTAASFEALELDVGVPVYGQVTQSEDRAGVAGAAVVLVDPATGARSNPVWTDDGGWYVLRALPGMWEVEVGGDDARHVPLQVAAVDVVDADGVGVGFHYATLTPGTVDGEVRSDDGEPLAGVTVRFRSVSLDGIPGASSVEETTTGTNGRYSVRTLPGTYEVELIPPYTSGWGPVRLEDVSVASGVAELGQVSLSPRPLVQGLVLDPLGQPAGGVVVRAQERGFAEHVFDTLTEEDGTFALEVSDETLSWTLVPPADVEGAATRFVAGPADVHEALRLHLGEPVDGCVGAGESPVAFSLVEVVDGAGTSLGSALTDALGCFALSVDARGVSTAR